jgi:putative transposase
MGFLKGKLALRGLSHFPELRTRYWGNHLWSRGYCVSTVGLDEAKIRKYVQWQEGQEKQQESQQQRLFD